MQNLNASSEQAPQKHRLRFFSLGLSAALCFTAPAAFAACLHVSTSTDIGNTDLVANDNVVCDATTPNPRPTSVLAEIGSTNVTITIEAGAGISPPQRCRRSSR